MNAACQNKDEKCAEEHFTEVLLDITPLILYEKADVLPAIPENLGIDLFVKISRQHRW